MTDAQRRALRTLLQALGGGVLVALWQVFAPPEWRMSVEQVAALTALLTAVVSFAQNWLEDRAGLPAVLKAPASEGQKPTPPDGGTVR
jgi:peptidoglycan/LPS O-acetylase OafA/YrhL